MITSTARDLTLLQSSFMSERYRTTLAAVDLLVVKNLNVDV